MATSLFPDTKEDQDSQYNPGELHAAEKFSQPYASSESDQVDAFANDPNNSSQAIKDQEESGSASNEINYTGNGNSKQKVTGKAWFKKKGPLSAIFALIIGGGAGLTMLGSPALLIVHFKEIMFDKFNTQLASMDARTSRLMSAKITGATSGHCGSPITIRCKFTSMSDYQVKQFKLAGIEIEVDKTTAITGRTVPKSFSLNGGPKIDAKNFNNEIIKNQDFKNAVKKGYNTRFASVTGKAWNTVAQRMGLQKKPPFEGAKDDKERTQKLNESVKNGATSEPLKPFSDEEKKDKSADEIKARETAIAEQAKMQSSIDSGAKSAVLDDVSRGVQEGAKNGVGALANVFKVTSIADIGCQAYGAIRAVGFAAKTVRAVQLARYAMVFLSVADSIKAGKAKPEDVAYAGTLMTQIMLDKNGVKKSGAATDSAGFKYAAFGDSSGFKKDNKVSQFLVGGGLAGDLINFSNTAASIAGGGDPKNAKNACQTLANPWVQAGSLLGGIALTLTGIGTVTQAVKAAGNVTLQVSLAIGLMILPELLKDIVAGNVTEGISGEASGNAITSGSGLTLGAVGAANGNAAMTKKDSLAYTNLQNETLAKYAEEDRQTLSPLDATNSNTFLGSVVSTLLPYTASLATPSSTISSLGSFMNSSFTNLIPTTSALTTEQHKAALEICQDPDYKDMGIATDPFCNVIYGIPPQYLNKDPVALVDKLTESGDIDENGQPKSSAYKDMVANCITRDLTTTPLGQGDDANKDGTNCIINDSNADFYVHYLDMNINEALESGYDTGSTDTSEQSSENSGAGVNDGNWAWPVDKSVKVSQPFGYSASYGGVHNGLDFELSTGSPFYAVRDGVVTNGQMLVTGDWCKAAGAQHKIGTMQNEVVITSQVDGQAYITIYAHVSQFKKKDGDVVKAGDLIALTGDSGCSTGPHAHLSIGKGTRGNFIDPLPLITQ